MALKAIKMKSNQFELEIDAKLENLSLIADFIETAMRQLNMAKSIYEVQTAVDEACTNIIKYACAGGENIISISCSLDGSDFIITIRDKGKPFDPSFVPAPDIEADWGKRQVGGLGMHLMRELMDEVSYKFNAEKGNTLTMRKRCCL